MLLFEEGQSLLSDPVEESFFVLFVFFLPDFISRSNFLDQEILALRYLLLGTCVGQHLCSYGQLNARLRGDDNFDVDNFAESQ